MAKILVSTGALIGRPNGRDYRLMADLKNKIKCDGFEFMMYSTWYDMADEVSSFFIENKIYTPTYHIQKSIGELITEGGSNNLKEALRRFEININMASRMQAKKAIMHLWNGEISDSAFENNLNAYAQLRSIADSFEVELLIENVVCNQKDPFYHWLELKEKYEDVKFVFDTKMAAFHGQLELLYDEKNSWLYKENFIRHYHVNDYAGAPMEWSKLKTLPIGAGNIDFDKFFMFVNKTGYDETFTLESTAFIKDGTVNVSMLNEQIDYVKSRLKEIL